MFHALEFLAADLAGGVAVLENLQRRRIGGGSAAALLQQRPHQPHGEEDDRQPENHVDQSPPGAAEKGAGAAEPMVVPISHHGTFLLICFGSNLTEGTLPAFHQKVIYDRLFAPAIFLQVAQDGGFLLRR